MNYIGSKLSLLDFIGSSIEQITGNSCESFCDLFAGTGIVGSYFKKKGYKIIANDIQYYSFVLNRHYIGNHNELTFSKLEKELPELLKTHNKKEFVCNYLSQIEGVDGFIYKNYSLGGTKNKVVQRLYFSDYNAKMCDSIRQKIKEWKNNKLICDDEYYFLLASLIESIDKYANCASVYGAFLKKLKASATKKLALSPAELITTHNEHQVFNKDTSIIAPQIKGDIMYLDPPYNHRQYATNYHILETIARYDEPQIYGKTGLRNYEDQKSLYCYRTKVREAFEELISKAKAKYIFLSYNNEGLMGIKDIKEIMSQWGKYGYFKKEYNRFKADKSQKRKYKASKTIEYLHYVITK